MRLALGVLLITCVLADPDPSRAQDEAVRLYLDVGSSQLAQEPDLYRWQHTSDSRPDRYLNERGVAVRAGVQLQDVFDRPWWETSFGVTITRHTLDTDGIERGLDDCPIEGACTFPDEIEGAVYQTYSADVGFGVSPWYDWRVAPYVWARVGPVIQRITSPPPIEGVLRGAPRRYTLLPDEEDVQTDGGVQGSVDVGLRARIWETVLLTTGVEYRVMRAGGETPTYGTLFVGIAYRVAED